MKDRIKAIKLGIERTQTQIAEVQVEIKDESRKFDNWLIRDRERLELLTDNMENRRIVYLSFLREKERQDKKLNLNVDLDE